MFTQYNKKSQCWEIYKLVQKGNKIKAYQLGTEQTKESAIRKMQKLYEERRIQHDSL